VESATSVTLESPPRFAAFISYSHKDRRWAEWLHKALESWRAPKGIEVTTTFPLRPVFIDRAELSSSADLGESVREALTQSGALIVICSPAAAKSRWVNTEVQQFKKQGKAHRIFCLVVEGNPGAGDCFPPAIRFVVTDDGALTTVPAAEPLAADARPGKDSSNECLRKLIAGLLGLPLDQLRRREAVRRYRRMMAITGASIVGCLIFGVLAVVAYFAKREADAQRIVAETQSLTARRTADFLKSLFVVSDPGEARGNSITAREVLDRGVEQIERQLTDQPLVRADLRTTLGEVYASLGLLKQSQDLLDAAAATPDKPPEMSARVLTALGELQYRRGDNDAALVALDRASQLLSASRVTDDEIRMRMLATLGDIYFRLDNSDKAREYFQQALKSARGMEGMQARQAGARALHGIAQADVGDGRFDEAAKELEVALAEQIAVSGERHPLVTEILNDLGSVEYLRKQPAAAARYFRRCLEIERQLLGNKHPSTAPTLNNLARVQLEQRQFEEARQLLEESIDIRHGEVLETAEEMVFAFSNHALSLVGLGKIKEAEVEFHKGLRAATMNNHRLVAPIMTDLADLECHTGRVKQGLVRLTEARPIMAERYPDDPWRVALVDNVRAGCLTRLQQYAEAQKLITTSTPVILKRWNAQSMYGHDAVARETALRISATQPERKPGS
jgi:tetratricopeptide (TPR) repeat protein